MNDEFTIDRMRQDIAEMIYADPQEIGDHDNLMDLGLDSMRAMNLVLLWQQRNLHLNFAELATSLTLAHWWNIAERKVAAAAKVQG
jgi:aryl carrier-like protein